MELCERNSFFWLSKLWFIVLLLFAGSAANASPTVAHQDIILTVSPSAADSRIAISSTNNVVKPVHTELANLAKEFLQPPAISTDLSNNQLSHIRPLPAVPATVLMLLTGFLCVSLYRDRKVWLMALAGLLWVSQAGIQTLPRLAHHFSHKYHTKQQICTELTYPYYLGNSHRLRCDIEGTRYIGLLHHLGGIPDDISTTNLHTSHSAIIFNNSLTLQFHCLASKAEQFICFSPAFIFETIPRGPPLLA